AVKSYVESLSSVTAGVGDASGSPVVKEQPAAKQSSRSAARDRARYFFIKFLLTFLWIMAPRINCCAISRFYYTINSPQHNRQGCKQSVATCRTVFPHPRAACELREQAFRR